MSRNTGPAQHGPPTSTPWSSAPGSPACTCSSCATSWALGARVRGRRRRRRDVVLEPLPGRPQRLRQLHLRLHVRRGPAGRSGSGASAIPEQHEIRAYLEHVAERFDLRRDITFDTRVTAATFDEAANTWTVTTDARRDGHRALRDHRRRRAVGVEHPAVRGHRLVPGRRRTTPATGRTRSVDFTGQRVGVIGTGASAVQAIPLIAKEASDLTVFQRTANYIVPANNGPVPTEVTQARKADYAGIRERIQQVELRLRARPRWRRARWSLPTRSASAELMARWERGRVRHLARQLRRHVLRRRGQRQGPGVPARPDPGEGRRPGDRRAADPQGLSVRRQAQPARLRLLRDVQPEPTCTSST